MTKQTEHETETLAQLVDARAGKGKGRDLTFAQLAERCVDPETGYRPSPNLLWKIASGQDVKINPPLIQAIAVGLSLPLERVQAAAAFQYTGLVAARLDRGFVAHRPGSEPGEREREVLERWEKEERGNPSASS